MRKDECPKVNYGKQRGTAKNEFKIQGSKGQPARSFLGCDTCKLKNGSLQLRKNRPIQDGQEKIKKNTEDNQGKGVQIKLTDLCDEDKKRIVELMEELSRFAEKNKSLRESLEFLEKAKQEQHECIVKQTNLHLEEKNIFLKEIQTYKARIEVYESDMKEKLSKWELKERRLDDEIRCLAKALQKSFNEKSDMMREIAHLKKCLKQSLESFELLRNEVSMLQRLSVRAPKSSLKPPNSASRDKNDFVRTEASDDGYQPAAVKDNPISKSSLDVINNKLEQLYVLLQSKNVPSETAAVSKPETEAKAPEKRSAEADEVVVRAEVEPIVDSSILQDVKDRLENQREEGDTKVSDLSYKFLKPFDDCGKTSIQAERILKNIEKSFSFKVDGKQGKTASESSNEELGDCEGRVRNSNYLRGSSLFRSKSVVDDQLKIDENQLLGDLFYTDAVFDLGVESALMINNSEKFYPSYS